MAKLRSYLNTISSSNLFFTKEENALLIKSEEKNIEDLVYWALPNVLFPGFIIFFSLVSYLTFKTNEKFSWLGFSNLVLNGSLPMVAINRISSIVNIIKYDKSKEKRLKTNTLPLRTKILVGSIILILLVVAQYIFQVINGPFEFSWLMPLQFLASLYFIRLALGFSKNAYLLQENFIERTLGDSIRESAKDNKKHLSDKYGN